MTAQELIEAIVTRAIDITPLVAAKRSSKYPRGTVYRWAAGFKTAAAIIDRGLVLNTDFALGKTLEEAVQRLLDGKTEYMISECKTGTVPNPEAYKEQL